MTTVAEIAAEAFTAVAAELTDVIKTCSITRTTQGAYNPTTGTYATTTATATGRAVFDTSNKIEDVLPGYVAGPAELIVYFEGLSFAPVENDTATIAGLTYTVKAVGDIAGAGSFYACSIVRS